MTIARRLATIFLRLTGWAFEGPVPQARRYVLIAAPHTSNWDFVYMMAMAMAMGIRLNWMGKASLFDSPLGGFYRALGGIPTYGNLRTSVVEQSVTRFRQVEDLVLAVPAEGTRRLAANWRSGFYHIALKAEVPIVLGYLDYARKRGGLGPQIRPSGDLKADMDLVRAFYAGKTGRYPAQFTEPRLAEEANGRPAEPQNTAAPPAQPARRAQFR